MVLYFVYPDVHLFTGLTRHFDVAYITWWSVCCAQYGIRRMKWRHSNLWSQYDLYLLSLHGVVSLLCEVEWWRFVALLPAALRAAQNCRYLIYSEADFEVFRPAGTTRCTDGGEIWHGGGDRIHAKFHPQRCNDKGVGPPKLKFLLRFDRNVEYKRPAGAYPLRDFHKICTVCTTL